MCGPESPPQRIARLTPLAAVLAAIERCVETVTPHRCPLAQSLGYVLAEDVAAPLLPQMAVALRDGFAVKAAAIADASSYAPVPLAVMPPRVEVGEPLPSGADAVLTFDALVLRGDGAEAIAAVSPGEGVHPVGADATPERPLRRAGERLRANDIAAMAAAGIDHVAIRAPRLRIGRGAAASSRLIDAAIELLAHLCRVAGGVPLDPGKQCVLEEVLSDDRADAVIGVGGTGSGRRDKSVRVLAQHGRVEAHGIAVSPGETAALGFLGVRPVLLVPGRLDAVIANWLLIGRSLTARLAGGSIEEASMMLPLKRKVASTIGLTELIPVACAGGVADPLACGYLSFEALARSHGFIVVRADSEGYSAGTPVAVRLWP